MFLYDYRKNNNLYNNLKFNVENLDIIPKEILIKYREVLSNFKKESILTEKEYKIYKK